MKPVYLLAGTLLLVAMSVDLLWTTLWTQGSAGPLTSRLMKHEWQALRRVFGDRQQLLSLSGPIILVTSLAVWTGLLWGGWTLLFAGGESTLLDTRNTGPISWTERLYFIGYSIFTLGNGDFSPQGGVWQVATALATGSGMLFITLSVTYVLSVLDAVTQKRAFASGVSGMGERSDEILRTSWNGEEFEGLELQLTTLSSELNTLTSNHKAYPILHYFHSPKAKNAPTVSIVLLEDLLTTLRFGVPEQYRPADLVVKSGRSAVGDYLETLSSAFIEPSDSLPPSPHLDPLRDADIPTVPDEEFADAVAATENRRRQLLSLVQSDRRDWPDQSD